MKKGKRGAASYIHNECINQVNSRHLSEILDILLNPAKAIDEWETIDWLKWLIAGGKTPDEYSALGKFLSNSVKFTFEDYRKEKNPNMSWIHRGCI